MQDLAEAVRDLADAVSPQRQRIGHQSRPTRIHAGHLARNRHFLAQWGGTVPWTHLKYDVKEDTATVRCHQPVVLARDEIAACPECDRHFWRLPDVPMVRGVRVARWERVELEGRYAGEGWTPVEAAA